MKNKNIILFCILLVSPILFFSIGCKAQDFTPNDSNTVIKGGTSEDTFIPGGEIIRQGTDAQTRIPGGDVSDPSIINPNDPNQVVQRGTAAQTAIPGGNLDPSSASVNPTSSNSGGISGLVPCRNSCTLCHIILGFKKIFDFFLGLLFTATMLVITVSGVFYMVSTGSKGMIDKAKKAITYGLLAFVVGMGSWLFVNLVMDMLGYQHPAGGSWWQFTCDTTQTQGPAITSAGPTLLSGAGAGAINRTPMPTDGSQISNALQKYNNVVYGQNGMDCSAYVQAVAKETGWDPGRSTADMMNGAIPFDQSKLVDGTVLVSSNSGGGRHAAYYYDGTIYHLANPGESPKTWDLNGYMSYANKNGNFVMRLPGT